MRYVEVAPCAALRTTVECAWSVTSDAPSPGHRVLPDGCMDVLFDRSGARVIGSMSRAIVTSPTMDRVDVFGVRFHPGEAAPFVRERARALRDGAVPLDVFWGPTARALHDEIMSTTSMPSRLRAIERVLLARHLSARNAKSTDFLGDRVREAIRFVRACVTVPSVAAIARAVGVTTRTLERAFDERVGVGPKLFARVMRMQRVVARIDRGVDAWSTLALDAGFADQAHLVRDLHELAGATPTALSRERSAVSHSFNPSDRSGAIVPPMLIGGPS